MEPLPRPVKIMLGMYLAIYAIIAAVVIYGAWHWW